jgi:hypothetical protein
MTSQWLQAQGAASDLNKAATIFLMSHGFR